jgi:hypothetical protein
MAYNVLATLRKDALDTENAIAYASRASTIAGQVDDEETSIRALRTIAMAEVLAGQPDGLDKLERNVAMCEAAELPNHVAGGFIYLLHAAALLRLYDVADRYLERAVTYTGERGHILSESYLHAFGAKIALDRGRWDEADELCTLVFQKRLTSILPRVLALTVRALVRARRGEAEAHSLLDEALELAEPSGELLRIAPVALAQAEVAWLAGDRDGIIVATDRVFADALVQGGPWPLPEVGFWRWHAGLHAPPLPDPEHPYAVQIAGEWGRAAERWTEIGCPYESALALADADDDEPLRLALSALERLGAEPAAARVKSRLAARVAQT